MSNTPTAIVLGGTYPHIRLLQNLKSRGFRTVLIDYHDNPCAKPFADIHLKESTLDRSKVINIAQSENATLVISSCIDQANFIACSVAEELGLPHPYNSKQALIATNKILMKKFMEENNIPSSNHTSLLRNEIFSCQHLKAPLIIKPADSNSSKGITKLTESNNFKSAINQAFLASRSGEVIVEEYLEGREVGIDLYIANREPYILMSKTRRKIPSVACNVQQIYGCFWPANLSEVESKEFLNIARTIAHALDLDNSPLMLQAIINTNGIHIIEFAARFGGGESWKIIELATGVDILDLSIRSFLGEPLKLKINAPTKMFAETFIYSEECIFDRIELNSSLFTASEVVCLHQYKTTRTIINNELTSNNRVGSFIVTGNEISELLCKTKNILASLEVFSTCNIESLRREMYKHEVDIVYHK